MPHIPTPRDLHPFHDPTTATAAEREAFAVELSNTKRALWREQVLRQHPTIERAVDLIPATDDEADYKAYAATLARFVH